MTLTTCSLSIIIVCRHNSLLAIGTSAVNRKPLSIQIWSREWKTWE